jgi:c-di-GMP-binding flagellar brake protein YcgR
LSIIVCFNILAKNISDMSLILANSHDIVSGKPIPWSLYTQEYLLLLSEGDLVRDDKHRDKLIASGAYRELAWETPEKKGDTNNLSPAIGSDSNLPDAELAKPDSAFKFDDMRLKVEDRLQLEPPSQLSHDRYSVRVIGYLRGASLLVTIPITPNGLRLQLMEKEKVVLRSFSGQNAFGFACTIERIIKIPYEYMHLSFPDNIQGIKIRKAPRIKVRIIATVQDSKSSSAPQVSALISDISANGVSIESKQALGVKGDILNLAFRLQLHSVDAYLSVKGIIRAVLSSDESDEIKSGLKRHGIEFQELQPNDGVVLQSMIYQQMIENPQNVM